MASEEGFDASLFLRKLRKNTGKEVPRLDISGNKNFDEGRRALQPGDVDWREGGFVSELRFQGACGTCWAFVAAGLVESRFAIDNAGILVSVSEQHIMDCTRDSVNMACLGGNQRTALTGNRVFHAAQFYPYIVTGSVQEERDALASEDSQFCFDEYRREPALGLRSGTSLQNLVQLNQITEEQLKEALNVGPVAVAAAAYNDAFRGYSGGVLDDAACASSEIVDHALLVVGFGTTEDGKDYWLAKNSWGKSFGENGYVKLARGVQGPERPYGQCAILFQADYLVPGSVECLRSGGDCSSLGNSQFCTAEDGCQTEIYFGEKYEIDPSTFIGSNSPGLGGRNQDSPGAGLVAALVLLSLSAVLAIALLIFKLREKSRDMELQLAPVSIERGKTPKESEFFFLVKQFRERLKDFPTMRERSWKERDVVIILYLEDNEGDLEKALQFYLEHES